MGWQIMGTDDTPKLTGAEIAECAIDFIENSGYPLVPWQAEMLRRMLTYPVDTRFIVNTSPRHPQRRGECPCLMVKGFDFDWRCSYCGLEHKATKTQARGSRADYVVMDEAKRCNTLHLTPEDIRACPEHGQGY